MARTPQSPPKPASTAQPATWADWLSKFQAFQVHALRDALMVYNDCFMSLASSRDARSAGAACQAALGEWLACLEGMQREWFALSKAVPEDALAAAGWRLKPGTLRAGDEPPAGAPSLLEQSRLGVEMLLRPWMPAPDLDHTDEFVA